MNVRFNLDTVGHFLAEFTVNDNMIKIGHSSNYGDKFQELLNNLFIIYDYIQDKGQNSSRVFKVLWQDDFVNYEWQIRFLSVDLPLEIQVLECSHENLEYSRKILDISISSSELFSQLEKSLGEIFNDFGFIGYKKVWGVGNFPVSEYLILKANSRNFGLKTESDDEDFQWKRKIIKQDEVEVIKEF